MTVSRLALLLRARDGVMAIETAIVAPVLILMALGTFQVGTMVSRQQELQSGAAEVSGIILAAASGAGTSSADIKSVVMSSLNLRSNQVTLLQRYRCGAATTLVADPATCAAGTQVYQYVLLRLSDTYTPFWTQFGVGAPFNYTVNRTIQIR